MSWSKRQDRARASGEDVPAHLERYELIDELGQGGMSVVFRARDKQLGRDVAVKLLHDFLARQADARKRFHREAVAVARLRHPAIVEIYDYSGPEAEDAYIVCELIEGSTLRGFVDEHGAPAHPELGVLVILELVRALRHAHEQGIVHRDVKPENVMITVRGQLKLMDFGIAQIMEGATKLTATGTLLGSPAHMAPEVIDGKLSDHRSDIFSVGTMLYWLSTGQLPFQAPNPSALFRLILEGTYDPPQMLNPRIGNGLARIIEHALDPDPEARYQDISELQDDLQKELDEVGLEPADSLVKQYLSDPAGLTATRSERIVETLVKRGREALEAGHTGRAMDRFNRVLAVAPEHPDVSRMVSAIGRRAAVARRAKRSAVFLSAGAAVALLGYVGVEMWPDAEPEPAPVAAAKAKPAAPKPAAAAEPANPKPVEPAPAKAGGGLERPSLEVVAKPSDPAPTRAPQPRISSAALRVRPRVDAVRVVRPAAGAGAVPSRTAAPKLERKVEAAAVAQAELQVKIGGGWAHIFINGKPAKKSAFDGTFPLAPGRHTIEVRRPDGHHPPRTIEVADGQVFEVGPSGKKSRLRGNELRFRVPRRGETVDGWVPSPKAAQGPSPNRGT